MPGTRAHAHGVFRYIPDARVPKIGWRPTGDIRPEQADAATIGFQPKQRFPQLLLAVSSNAGHTQNFAGVGAEVGAPEAAAGGGVCRPDSLELQGGVTARRRRPISEQRPRRNAAQHQGHQ